MCVCVRCTGTTHKLENVMKLWKYTPHVPTASKHVYYTFIVSWVELSMVFGKFSDLPFLSVFVVYLCCVPPYNTINLCYCICISVSLRVGVCVGECLYDVYTSYNTVSIYNKRKLFEKLLKSSFRDCIYSFLLGWSPIAHFGAGTLSHSQPTQFPWFCREI